MHNGVWDACLSSIAEALDSIPTRTQIYPNFIFYLISNSLCVVGHFVNPLLLTMSPDFCPMGSTNNREKSALKLALTATVKRQKFPSISDDGALQFCLGLTADSQRNSQAFVFPIFPMVWRILQLYVDYAQW